MRRLVILMMLGTVIGVQAQVSPTSAYEAIDKTLTEKLRLPYGGDVDVDFLTRMIAQHDAAIERSKAAIANSTDAKVRMMAGDMLKTLHADQRVMKEWLALHGPKPAAAAPAPLPKALPQTTTTITTTEKMRIAATLPVSTTLVVTPTVLPTAVVSSTYVIVETVSPSVVAPQAMPELPAHDAEIENTAPVMEFLDGGQ
ncbi:MAG: DUF305 domain-containing protein [Alphaproteobacteria bacterium]|nr:MAG: DUF305 domain-containing protein [Alphaproteobacteria bacterium]